MSEERWCKDCVEVYGGRDAYRNVKPKRPVADGAPGPRCATHARAWKKRGRELAHGRHVATNFDITADEYAALYAAQGGKCALCRIATGKARKLAVDHDHDLCEKAAAALGLPAPHPRDKGCRRCIRGLLCKRCNWFVAHFPYDALVRAINYLFDPPARKVLR